MPIVLGGGGHEKRGCATGVAVLKRRVTKLNRYRILEAGFAVLKPSPSTEGGEYRYGTGCDVYRPSSVATLLAACSASFAPNSACFNNSYAVLLS